MYPKLQVIKKVSPCGEISTKAMYCNIETPRYNMQSFIMLKMFKTGNMWDERLRKKADSLINEGEHYFMFEDSENNVYTIRKNPL